MSNVSPLVNPPSPQPPSRRPATEADVPFLLALRTESLGPHYLAAGIPQSPPDREAKVRLHFDCTEIIESQERSVGMLKVLRAQSEWRLVQIQLVASHRCTGIGSLLVGALVEEAKVNQASLCLSVLKASPARRLYERSGFVVTSESENVFHMRAAG